MKLHKIADVCRSRGRMCLFDVVDEAGCVRQWIGNGAACYPVDGMPYLEEEHLRGVFGLTDKQCTTMLIGKTEPPGGIDLQDVAQEALTENVDFKLIYGGSEMRMVRAENRTFLIQEKLVRPIMEAHENAEIFLRKDTAGGCYMAIKEGLLLVGIVCPYILQEIDKISVQEAVAAL